MVSVCGQSRLKIHIRRKVDYVDSITRYNQIASEIDVDYLRLPKQGMDPMPAYRKRVGLFLKNSISQYGSSLNHPSVMFPKLLGQKDDVEKYIHKTIKPVGNVVGE